MSPTVATRLIGGNAWVIDGNVLRIVLRGNAWSDALWLDAFGIDRAVPIAVVRRFLHVRRTTIEPLIVITCGIGLVAGISVALRMVW